MRALVDFSGGVGASGSVRAGDTFDADAVRGVALADSGHAEPVDAAAAVAEVEASAWNSPALAAFVARGGAALERRKADVALASGGEPATLSEAVGHPSSSAAHTFWQSIGRAIHP
jgi:hypothetical protein